MELPGVDFEKIRSGEIPWTLEELLEAMTRGNWLHETPHDDWDRQKRGFILVDDETGEEGDEYVFNPDNYQNQLFGYVAGRNRDHAYDQTTSMSHMWRLMEIQYFIGEYFEKLSNENLIRDCEENPEMAELSEAVLEVLATTPYTAEREAGGEIGKTFDYESVVLRAKNIQANHDSE